MANMSPNRTRLVLIDAAGTLIEPAEPVEAIYQQVFSKYGWEVEAAPLRKSFRATFGGLGDPHFSGHPDGDAAERAWWREVVRRTGLAVGIEPEGEVFDGCFEELFEYYASGKAWAVFPEVEEVLDELRARGVKLAVVSNFDRRLHRVLAELDLAAKFDLILTSADVSSRKPSPTLLEVAMDRLAQPPAATRLVGDSHEADGGAAEAAGVQVFIVDRPRTTLRDFLKWLDEDF
jgi:putative hydrolase of the HAD superfamily